MKSVWKRDPAAANFYTYANQLNKYRVDLKRYKGIEVDELFLFIMVRDANTGNAMSNGVKEKTYYVKVPILPDEEIEKYYSERGAELVSMIEGTISNTSTLTDEERERNIIRSMPKMCDSEECWDGRKCKYYCEVAEFCKQAGDNPYLYDD
jgi:hypothetical protein